MRTENLLRSTLRLSIWSSFSNSFLFRTSENWRYRVIFIHFLGQDCRRWVLPVNGIQNNLNHSHYTCKRPVHLDFSVELTVKLNGHDPRSFPGASNFFSTSNTKFFRCYFSTFHSKSRPILQSSMGRFLRIQISWLDFIFTVHNFNAIFFSHVKIPLWIDLFRVLYGYCYNFWEINQAWRSQNYLTFSFSILLL